MNEPSFPRVLFVTSHAFNHHTGGGVTFSNLFAGWPKDRLATVHNDPAPVTTDVCERYFVLGPDEIRKWGGLSRIAGRGAGPAPAEPDGTAAGGTADGGGSRVRRSLTGVRSALFGDAEIPETVRLSPRLRQWIADFRPEVLYTILGNLSLMRLVELIRAEFDLPLAVHFMDDWKGTAYARGLLSPPRRRTMLGLVDRLVRSAAARMAISDAMCAAYEKEFGLPFAAFQNVVDLADWPSTEPAERHSDGTFTLFYGGAILPFAQLYSLADVCRAVDSLDRQGLPIRFDIYAPAAMVDAHRALLAVGPAVRLHPSLADHDTYVRELRRADLLVLPVNFDEPSRRFIRYSMPTKVPEYMASGVPVLVYGPPEVAPVRYARSDGWGEVVDARDVVGLAGAIRRLADDPARRGGLVAAARNVVGRRHDGAVVRRQFRRTLAEARSAGGGGP